MANFQTFRLEECLDKLIDYRGKSPEKSLHGIPVLSAKVVKTSGLIEPIEQKVAPDYYERWMTRGFPQPGDVVFTTEGPLGEVIQLDDRTAQFALGQRIVCLRGKPGVLDNTFLRYMLASPAQQAVLQSFATGTTVLGISQKALRSVPFALPDFVDQIQIGATLKSLDDKIELNRKTNKTLEATAQAIFRDWFVDFGPVRRKMAGASDPSAILGGLLHQGTPNALNIANLFPDRLGDNGLPEGWRENAIHELAEWVNGAAYKKMHFVEPDFGLPVVKIAELKAGISKQTKFTNTDLGEKFRIGDGELLFSWSGNPDTSIDTFIWTEGDAWLNQHIFAVRENGRRSKAHLFFLLKSLMPKFSEIARDKQTTGLGHVTRGDMKRLLVADAPPELLKAYDELCEPIFEKMFSNLIEAQLLAQTRDFLVPKLMSGDIRASSVGSH